MHTGAAAAATRAMVVLAVVLAVAIGTAVTVIALREAPHGTQTEQMVAVSPGGHVDLEELSPALRQLYEDVAADPIAFEHVRCYCGCEAMLEHRHLRDCFQRPDGGWERHAVGCGVCQSEARQVVALRADGTPLDQIVAQIDETYAGITEGS